MFRYLPRGHEVLIVERHTQLAFACGAAVFPGGRIDDDDRRIAALPDICAIPSNVEADDAAGRIAAIRESLEETGIAIGIERLVPPEWQSWKSEERRVGKSVSVRVDLGGRRIIQKKIVYSARRCQTIILQ